MWDVSHLQDLWPQDTLLPRASPCYLLWLHVTDTITHNKRTQTTMLKLSYYQGVKYCGSHFYLYSAKHANVSTLNMCISFSSCLQKLLILQQEFLTVVKQWWFPPVTTGFAFWGVCVVPFGVSSNKVRTAKDSSLKILSPLIGQTHGGFGKWMPGFPSDPRS